MVELSRTGLPSPQAGPLVLRAAIDLPQADRAMADHDDVFEILNAHGADSRIGILSRAPEQTGHGDD